MSSDYLNYMRAVTYKKVTPELIKQIYDGIPKVGKENYYRFWSAKLNCKFSTLTRRLKKYKDEKNKK